MTLVWTDALAAAYHFEDRAAAEWHDAAPDGGNAWRWEAPDGHNPEVAPPT